MIIVDAKELTLRHWTVSSLAGAQQVVGCGIVSGNLQQISFKSSEVSLSCKNKTARNRSVQCTNDVEPKNFIRKHRDSLSFDPQA